MQFDHDFERIIPTSSGVDSLNIGGAGLNIPAGIATARPATPIVGSLRFNTTSTQLEVFDGTFWQSAITSIVAGTNVTLSQTGGAVTVNTTSGGSVSSVALALPSMFTVTGSPVTTTGTLTGTLATQANNVVLAGPASGGPLAPTFRTLSLAGNDLTDVLITSPVVNQVLAWNGTDFVNTGAVGANATGLVGVGQAGAAAWTLSSGKYIADFAHNLATYNVVVTVFNTATNALVIPDAVTLTSTNNVRIQATTNTTTLRVVVVANGQSIVSGGSTPSSVATAIAGVTVNATATKLNFTGQAVSVTDAGGNTSNISIGSRFTYFANSLDSVNNADFVVNALSPVTTDPTYAALNVRSFSNTVEQGVGFLCSIPPGATTATLKFRGRASTAPGAAAVVQPRLYSRLLTNNAAVSAWSAATELANIAIPTNAFFQYAQQTVALSAFATPLVAGNLYQFELTRRVAGVTGGTNLASNWLLCEVTIELS